MIWTHYLGSAHYWVHGTQLLGGFTLGLLGLLSIGSAEVEWVHTGHELDEANPLYRVLIKNVSDLQTSALNRQEVPLVVVAGAYLIVYFLPRGMLMLWGKIKGKDVSRSSLPVIVEEQGDESEDEKQRDIVDNGGRAAEP